MNTRFEKFIAPARTRPQIWRIIVGLVLCTIVWALTVSAIFALAWAVAAPQNIDTFDWLESIAKGETAFGALVLLTSFIGLALGPMLAARWIHKRPVSSLFGPKVRVLRDFVTTFAIVMIPFLILTGLTWFGVGGRHALNLDLGMWLLLLPLTFITILIQTGAEELVFRGYLLQQLAARFRSPLIWMILPALLFGAIHYAPQYSMQSNMLVIGSATLVALLVTDLTVRTGSLGAAWGFHCANNVFAIAIVSVKDTINGLSLFVTTFTLDEMNVWPGSLVEIFVYLGLWLLLRRVLSR